MERDIEAGDNPISEIRSETTSKTNSKKENIKNNKFSYAEYYKQKNKEQYAMQKTKTQPAARPENINELGEIRPKERTKPIEHKHAPISTQTKPISSPKKPFLPAITKVLIFLIPVIIILYLVYTNFLASEVFTYYYDIGTDKVYLSPDNRITGAFTAIDIEDPDYKELTGPLVYFNVPIPRGADKITVKTRFQNNFPNKSSFHLGAKDSDVWHYTYTPIYKPVLENLHEFKNHENVYLINPALYLMPEQEVFHERNVVIATDKSMHQTSNLINDYKPKTTIINTSLRGGHVFYVYVSYELDIEIRKQDLNWYEGSDELELSIYDTFNNKVANITIPDDGIEEINKTNATIQERALNLSGLTEGVYKIVISDADVLIRQIKVNTNKIVAEKLFLADTRLYGVENKTSSIYTKLNRESDIRLMTYHSEGIQPITYINPDNPSVGNVFNFSQEDEPMFLTLNQGEYLLFFPKNDIIVSSTNYLAFSKENYFEPFKNKIISIPNDIEYIRSNIDYVVTDYQSPVDDRDDWLVSETEFNIQEDHLFVKDNELSFVFNAPHLGNEELKNNTIPVDWIQIEVYKKGWFG